MRLLPFRGLTTELLGAGLLLALSLPACTDKGTTFTPGPITPPTPPAPVANEDARNYADYTDLVWSDEFDAGTLDATKWKYDLGGGGWGNNELETYTNSTDNVFLSGGNLTIKAIRSGTGSYTSGRILTKSKKDFVFGRIDVRAQVPKGKGVWPAIWMLGSDIDQNNWPKCGEIDIMELRGSKPRELLTTMHFQNTQGVHGQQGTTQMQPADLSDGFHTYSAVRSKDQTRFYVDGQQYYTFGTGGASPNPFNNPFFVVLNVAIGGDFDGNPDASTTFPQQMQVDYVRYYQYK
ncbi:glycoside hydrolase family 16 protein [Hymenobacter sp. BT770]|uniref:glycoside hydrolase family 16 protein n=1 Tax=Hymenobacter sp. BT770 TaxID=2886942 RepID=UPI001D10EDA6|nr:glycoside hydrolase family 16 protein [Hymenobacter sp. BT770]MCC3151757.1 glycoside hydrolase family 16 protein [Hymenobacter sp. BT770]MDO3413621.1 glycoside hydrolase family 16 protein [Hymenobacter sp. BT770]